MAEVAERIAGPIEPSFGGVILAIATGRWLLLGGALTGFGLAFLWVLVTPPEYRATMVVGPVATLADDAVGAALPGQLQAAPGRRRLDHDIVSNFHRFVELLNSVEVARRLSRQPDAMRLWFPESWDAETGSWRPPRHPLAALERWGTALIGRAGWAPPEPEDLAARVGQRLWIDPVGITAMRRLSLRHRDRAVALDLLAAVHRETDELLRETAGTRAEAHIGYLNAQLGRVTLSEHRHGLTVLLSQQERDRMLIRVALPYAADPIEPPTAPLRPDWPNPMLILPVVAAAGLFGALLVVFLRAGRAGGEP